MYIYHIVDRTIILENGKLQSRLRVAIFTSKQTALYFTGLGMVFKRLSKATKETISVVNCMKNLMVLIVFTEFAYKKC